MIDYGFNNPSYPDGSTFTVATNASTVYQGIDNFSALAAGMIANLDLTLQSDGSLLATRIEVDDPERAGRSPRDGVWRARRHRGPGPHK